MNEKTERIKKLYAKGMSLEGIAKKIGYGNNIEAGIERIKLALMIK